MDTNGSITAADQVKDAEVVSEETKPETLPWEDQIQEIVNGFYTDGTPEWTDCMIDIETTSTQPDRGAILQIGAVKFNLEKGTVCENFFDQSLTIPPHRFWSEDTRTWWLQQKREILTNIMARARNYRTVMVEFQQWSQNPRPLRFWAKPSHFDYNFISSYFADEGMSNPFPYYDARDLRSYLEGLFAPNPVPEEIAKMPFVGDAHNALNDALYQLGMLMEAKTVAGK